MAWQVVAYGFILILIGAISTASTVVIWRSGRMPWSRALAVVTFALGEWMVTHALQLWTPALATKVFWLKLELAGLLTLPLAWWIAVADYSGYQNWPSRRVRVLLTFVTAIILLLVFTNDAHFLIWTNVALKTGTSIPILRLTYNLGGRLLLAYSFSLLLASMIPIIKTVARTPEIFQWQVSVFLLGALTTGIVVTFQLLRLAGFPGYELSLIALAIMSLFEAYILLRWRLEGIVPVARAAVVENMSDDVIVLDEKDRVLDLNPAALKLIGRPRATVVSQPIGEIWPAWQELSKLRSEAPNTEAELILGQADAPQSYDVRVAQVADSRGRLIGRVVVLRDITKRKQAETQVKTALNQLKNLFENLDEVFFSVDTVNKRLLQISPSCEKVFGLPAEAFFNYSQSWDQMIYPEDKAAAAAEIGNLVYGKAVSTDVRIVRPDGEIRSLEVKFKPSLGESGRLNRVDGIVSDVTRRKQLEEAARGQLNLIEALRDTAATLNSTQDLSQVLDRILENVGRVVPHDAAAVLLIESDMVHIARSRNYTVGSPDEIVEGLRLPMSQYSDLLRNMETGHPSIIPDNLTFPGRKPAWLARDVRSQVQVPIRTVEEVIGYLSLGSVTADSFRVEHGEHLQAFADQAAVALTNARLMDGMRRRAEQLGSLYDAGLALNSALDLRTQLELLMKNAMKVANGDLAEFFRFEPERNELVGEYYITDLTKPAESLRAVSFRIGDQLGCAGWVAKSRTSLNLGDVHADPRYVPLEPAMCSGLWVPVEHENWLFGVLVIKSRRPNAFTSHDESLVFLFGQQAAVAMRNARLLVESQRRISELSAVNRVTSAITSTLNLDEILDLAIHEISELLSAEVCLLMLLDNQTNELVPRVTLGLDPEQSQQIRLPLNQGIAGWVACEAQSALVNDVHNDARWCPRVDAPGSVAAHSILAVPLKSKGRVIGIIEAINKRQSRFSDDDLRLLETISLALAEGIENARLFSELDRAYGALAEEKKQILESRNILRAVFDGITEDIFIVDRGLEIKAINKSAAAQVEREPTDLIEKHCYEVLCQKSNPCPDCLLNATFREGKSRSARQSRIGRDGGRRELEVRTYPLETEGRIDRAICIAQDVTESLKMEAALLQTAKLSMVGELGAGIAHEISNPLTAIIANAQMLLRTLEPLNPDYQSAQLIERAALRADRVTRNLLNLARQEEYLFAPTDLNQTIEGAISLLSHSLRSAGIQVRKNYADLPLVNASWAHLETVWMNLLLNARDAVPEGQPGRIEITTRLNPDLRRIEAIFTDNGCGIPEEELDKIFEPFHTSKPRGKGTGLGLYTSHAIVTQHQGTIEVQSRVSVGSRFRITLPLNGHGE